MILISSIHIRYSNFLCSIINGVFTATPKLFHDLANKEQSLQNTLSVVPLQTSHGNIFSHFHPTD